MKNHSVLLTTALVLFVITPCVCWSASPGHIKAWGSNEHGQCNVPTGSDFVSVSAGYSYGLAGVVTITAAARCLTATTL